VTRPIAAPHTLRPPRSCLPALSASAAAPPDLISSGAPRSTTVPVRRLCRSKPRRLVSFGHEPDGVGLHQLRLHGGLRRLDKPSYSYTVDLLCHRPSTVCPRPLPLTCDRAQPAPTTPPSVVAGRSRFVGRAPPAPPGIDHSAQRLVSQRPPPVAAMRSTATRSWRWRTTYGVVAQLSPTRASPRTNKHQNKPLS